MVKFEKLLVVRLVTETRIQYLYIWSLATGLGRRSSKKLVNQ